MISQEEIKHVANLVKLELTNQEISQYSQELSAIVSYIDQLKEVKTDEVEPTAQVTGLLNQWREDKARPWNEEETAVMLKQAKAKPGQEIKVKRVLN